MSHARHQAFIQEELGWRRSDASAHMAFASSCMCVELYIACGAHKWSHEQPQRLPALQYVYSCMLACDEISRECESVNATNKCAVIHVREQRP
jgi:hypothetical protein